MSGKEEKSMGSGADNLHEGIFKPKPTTERPEPPKGQGGQALRYNTGKPELSYILDVMPALKDMVAVLEFGANKYERNNWQNGFPKDKLLDSMLRHIDAFYSGEDVDPESGLPHVGHILCNAALLGYHYGSGSDHWKEKVGQIQEVDFEEELNDILVDGVDVYFPAGMDARPSVALNEEGVAMLKQLIGDIRNGQ